MKRWINPLKRLPRSRIGRGGIGGRKRRVVGGGKGRLGERKHCIGSAAEARWTRRSERRLMGWRVRVVGAGSNAAGEGVCGILRGRGIPGEGGIRTRLMALSETAERSRGRGLSVPVVCERRRRRSRSSRRAAHGRIDRHRVRAGVCREGIHRLASWSGRGIGVRLLIAGRLLVVAVAVHLWRFEA